MLRVGQISKILDDSHAFIEYTHAYLDPFLTSNFYVPIESNANELKRRPYVNKTGFGE